MQHTRPLRSYFASVQGHEALALARRQRWPEALEAADRCTRLDPTLSHPYILKAKISFWRGDLPEARRQLREASARGLERAKEVAMSAAIDELESRAQREHEAREHAQARTAAMAAGAHDAFENALAWFDAYRLTQIAFLAAIFALLVFGGLR
jgi:tetratricopeptide (TPR) repeat protein